MTRPLIHQGGYARHTRESLLDRITAAGVTHIADIRLVPKSWRFIRGGAAIRNWYARHGITYSHHPGFGNAALDEDTAPVLADPDAETPGILDAIREGKRIVLLCACLRDSECHRSLVARHLRAALPGLEVAPLDLHARNTTQRPHSAA